MNLDYIEQMVAVLGEFPVSEIILEQNGRRIQARRPLTLTAPALAAPKAAAGEAAATQRADFQYADPQSVDPAAEQSPEPSRTLLAPMVGIFHHAEPPLSFASSVRVGQIIGYIESMKLMNEVLAEEVGKITDVLAENGAPVEYGQPLFRVAG